MLAQVIFHSLLITVQFLAALGGIGIVMVAWLMCEVWLPPSSETFSMMGITQRQREALDFIRSEVKEKGVAPTCEEIRSALLLTSTGEAFRLLNVLAARGHISFTVQRNIATGECKRKMRGIKLVETKYDHGPDCLCVSCPARKAQYQQFIQALKVEPPVTILARGNNFCRLSDFALAQLIRRKPVPAAKNSSAALPTGVRR